MFMICVMTTFQACSVLRVRFETLDQRYRCERILLHTCICIYRALQVGIDYFLKMQIEDADQGSSLADRILHYHTRT